MRIAVYSGSFNPLHIGHQAIMEYLTREKKFDWVYLVVSPKNPLKDSISADSGRDRYNAAVEAVKRHPDLHVWVDDIELNMDPPHYTIRTLDELKRREPANDFTRQSTNGGIFRACLQNMAWLSIRAPDMICRKSGKI